MRRNFYRNPHFWYIIAIMLIGTLVFYSAYIPVLNTVFPQMPFHFIRYSTYRILSIIPVAYAAFAFKKNGGIIATVFISLGLLPRALLLSDQPAEATIETFAFFFIGMLVTWLIHRQQFMTQRLQTSEERYRGLFENSIEAILVCSLTGRIMVSNKACEKLTGYNRNELINTAVSQLFTGESLKKINLLFAGEIEPVQQTDSDELFLLKRDGTKASIELRISPLFKEEEKIGFQIIARDVTEEQQLRKNMDYYIKQITRAQEDERLRISRELHDDTAQGLAILSRSLDTLASRAEDLPGPVISELEKLHDTANLTLQGVRRYSQDLRPSILDDLGLVPALEWLVADLETGSGLTARVTMSGDKYRLVPEKELTIFRICQEVLSNIRRHSGASSVEMTLDYGTDALTLIISDNGRGFNLPQRTSDLAVSGKLGIIGMRERARLIGGTLVIQSSPGTGTTVTLRISN